MTAPAKTLVPRVMRDSTDPAPQSALDLDSLLSQTGTVGLKEIGELSRFVPVLVLVPESSLRRETLQPRIERNKSPRQTAKPLDIVQAFGAAPELTLSAPEGEFGFGRVRVNFREMSACRNGQPVELTTMEFKALKYLVQNARRVISRNELLNEVWGYENYPCTRTVDNHILRLRQKLEQYPSRPVHIRTVHGAGYKFLP